MSRFWHVFEIAAWLSACLNAWKDNHAFAAGCVALACYCYLRQCYPTPPEPANER